MSTAQDPQAGADEADELDPYRYGWRYVRRGGDDDCIPLTLDDVLHPLENDFHVQLPSHNDDCGYLRTILRERVADRPSILVVEDCRVDFNIPGVRPLGPDVAVILGVDAGFDRGTLDIAAEGGRPALVIEVTSRETRHIDLGRKKRLYARAGVPTYVIVDVRHREGVRPLTIRGHRLTRAGYRTARNDARGRFRLGEPLDVWIGADEGRVVLYDGATDAAIGDYAEVARAARAAEARAATEFEARSIAEARAATESEARSVAEARAIAAEARSAEVEALMHAMEAELRRLRGEP